MVRINSALFLLIAPTLTVSAQVQNQNETIQEMFLKIHTINVKPTSQPMKDYAIHALKNSVQSFCMAHDLDFKQCSKKQASEMREWFAKQAERDKEVRKTIKDQEK